MDIVFWDDRRTNYTKWEFFAKGDWDGELSVGIGGGNVFIVIDEVRIFGFGAFAGMTIHKISLDRELGIQELK